MCIGLSIYRSIAAHTPFLDDDRCLYTAPPLAYSLCLCYKSTYIDGQVVRASIDARR